MSATVDERNLPTFFNFLKLHDSTEKTKAGLS